MNSRSIALVLGLVTIIFSMHSVSAAADSSENRIMVLYSHNAKPYEEALEGFKGYLSSKGWQARFDVYPLDGNAARASELLGNAGAGKVRIIVALGALAASAAVESVSQIPIVAGLILSEEEIKKSGNVSEVVLEFPLTVQLQWMKRIIPDCKNIGILYNPKQNLKKVEAAKALALNMGIKLLARQVLSPSDIPEALESMSKKVDALWGIPDDMVYTPQTARQILLFSYRNRIPLIGISGEWVKAGALYALERDYGDLGAQCGETALKILQGAQPASINPEPPRKVLYLLNLKAAEEMNLEFKESLIQGAKQVFK